MATKEYDPLNVVPSSEALRRRLESAERLAARLRILLDVAIRIEETEQRGAGKGVPA